MPKKARANAASATVAYASGATTITPTLTGGAATSLAIDPLDPGTLYLGTTLFQQKKLF